jgi:hypothetical protein
MQEELELGAADFEQVRNAYRQLRAEISAAAKSRLQNTPELSDPGKGIMAYKIEPFPDEGKEALSRFQIRIRKALGDSRANLVLERFPPHQFFGNMGQNEVRVVFQDIQMGDEVVFGLRS